MPGINFCGSPVSGSLRETCPNGVKKFKNRRLTLILAICLVILYVFLFSLIQLKDYALLMGGVGLFTAMALIMYASRNVDWYGESSVKDKDRQIGF